MNSKFKKFYNLHNRDLAFQRFILDKSIRPEAKLWQNYVQFLWLAKRNYIDQIPISIETANWLLLAGREKKNNYENHCVFSVTPLDEQYTQSVISCVGRSAHFVVIPCIPSGIYNYYNGNLLIWDEIAYTPHSTGEVMLKSVCDFSEVFITDKIIKNKKIYQIDTGYINIDQWSFSYKEIQRAMHAQSFGKKAQWFYDEGFGLLKMVCGNYSAFLYPKGYNQDE